MVFKFLNSFNLLGVPNANKEADTSGNDFLKTVPPFNNPFVPQKGPPGEFGRSTQHDAPSVGGLGSGLSKSGNDGFGGINRIFKES
ncbi:MAG: hypothetical protein K2X66_05490 [Cyanobacteria bacterium]|nr:hypothetical protein [Cyanobacteriota bacterium]